MDTWLNKKGLPWLKDNFALIIGLAIAVVLSAVTYHGDFYVLSKLAERVAGGNLHLYQGLVINGTKNAPAIMPPAIFLFDGFLYFLFKATHIIYFTIGPSLNIMQLLILKLRYVFILLLSYPLVKKAGFLYTKDKVYASKIANIWITSPILLYLTFTQGNNDIYPAFLLLVTLYFIFKGKFFWGMVFLGLAASLKSFSIFLIIPFALILGEKDIKKSILLAATACGAFILPILPYLKDLKYFFATSGESGFIFRTILPSRNDYLIFPLVYFLIILFLFFSDNLEEMKKDKFKVLLEYGFLVLSLFFALSFFLPQWLLWILPFTIFIVYKDKRLYYIYLLIATLAFFSLIMNYNNNLDLSLYRPILPALTNGTVIFPGITSAKMFSMVYTCFLALFSTMVFFIFKKEKNVEKLDNNYIWYNLAPFLFLAAMLFISLLFTLKSSHDITVLQNNIVKDVSTGKHIVAQYPDSTIEQEGIPFNLTFLNQEIIPITNDPGVILPFNISSLPRNNNYIVYKYSDNKTYSPQLFWSTYDTKSFSDATSWTNFVKIDGGYYYSKLPNNFPLTGVKYLRVDPDNTSNPLDLEYVTIINLN